MRIIRPLLPALLGLVLVGCKNDADKDGFTSDVDCNDNNPEINPDAVEVCNDIDDDCDGTVDNDAGATWYADADDDGYGDDDSTTQSCDQPTGYVAIGGDCDDTDDRFRPGAQEDDCTDPNDYNCDGSTGYDDADDDGVPACEDCDDSDAAINPSADEICDDVDNDCDELIDEADSDIVDASTWYIDYDADGFGSDAYTDVACDQPTGFVDNADDCDDLRDFSYPGADELCDGYDNDCDDEVDEDAGDLDTYYADTDLDGYGDPDSTLAACAAPDGYVTNALDCDDSSGDVSPAADEVCNDIDDDCDDLIDDDDTDTLRGADDLWYLDADEDGFGDPATYVLVCVAPDGYVDNSADCDDGDGAVNPDALEVCDGIDNDCNEGADEDSADDATTWYLDTDGDGYGQTDETTVSCDAPDDYTDLPDDCDDDEAAVNPGAEEVCNDGLDNDCDDGYDGCETELELADAVLLGQNSLDDAGVAIASLGDLDGDGDDEFMVGARNNDNAGTDAGAAYLFLGTIDSGTSTGLGSADATITGADGGDKLGRDIAGGYDVDGDDVPDVIISAPSDETGGSSSGSAYVFSGADLVAGGDFDPSDALHTLTGESTFDFLGVQVRMGDVTGDGVADILASATGDDAGAAEAGAIYVIAGPVTAGTTSVSAGTVTAKIIGENGSDQMGQAYSAGGDFDGDGVGDLAVGVVKDATIGANSGALYLVLGGLSGTIDLGDADVKILGADTGDNLGGSVAFMGDQDDDGNDDIVVGAALEDSSGSDAGAVYVLEGIDTPTDYDAASIDDIATATILAETTADQFGTSVAGGGDFDGDGTPDVLIGATGAGEVSPGAAYLFYGPVTGSYGAADADGILYGETASDGAGGVVAFAGDVTGTDVDAVAVSARNSDRAGTDAGAVYLVFELGL